MPPQYTVQLVGLDWLYTSSNVRGFEFPEKNIFCLVIWVKSLERVEHIMRFCETVAHSRSQRHPYTHSPAHNLVIFVFKFDVKSYYKIPGAGHAQ